MARNFADGVDFWRIHYTSPAGNESTQGPYLNEKAVRRERNTNIRWAEDHPWPHNAHFLTGKIQKLTAVYGDCTGEATCMMSDAGSICFVIHTPKLEWIDVEES